MRRLLQTLDTRNDMKFLRTILILGISIIASFILSIIWWNAWMYKGFSGPFVISGALISCDGEFCYSLKQLDMFLISLGLMIISIVLIKVLRRYFYSTQELK
jgi:hypothetical protein